MNIIFLDMDGVINSGEIQKEWVKKNGFSKESRDAFIKKYCLNTKFPFYYIVPELLNRFNEMYSKIPNCRVVWSSSWRLTAKKESKLFVEGLYYKCGFPNGSFIGYTSHMPHLLRYNEIEDWIKTFKDVYQIDKCAIIDDLYEASLGVDEFLGIPIKFFQTSGHHGLTEEIANNIVKYFEEINEKDENK